MIEPSLPDNEGVSRPSDPVPLHNLAWKRQEEELVETKAEAEFYLDLMSHDIRNLTQIGVGYIELALESPDAGEIRSLMEKAQEALQGTADIVDNVRKLQEVRQRKVENKTVNLSEVLSCMLSRYTISTSREITINLKTMPRSEVWANDLVIDVFSNLINSKIWVEDRMPGDYSKGARFVVVLPAA